MKSFKFLLILLVSNFYLAQNNFELDLTAKNYENDSLIFGVTNVKNGFKDLYKFKLETNKSLTDASEMMGGRIPIYKLKVKEKNIIKGKVDYPIPVGIMYINEKTNQRLLTSIFFVEKGKYKYDLPAISSNMDVNINTPSNFEYKKLKEYLQPLYIKSNNPYQMDSLTDFKKKQDMISKYIAKNPNSYVALWEIVNDYTYYNYKPEYLENMKLFSKDVKKSAFYKNLLSKLMTERETMVGSTIPDILFDKTNSLKLQDFKKYKLTFIDYWSTTCAPCIKAMPEVVKLYYEFKDKNVNFITVTDDNKTDRMALAKKILSENNAEWKNYFDVNKDFSKKVNATGYPLQFVIDSNGKILARIDGDLDEVKKIIEENIN